MMETQILLLVAAAMMTGACFGVLAVGIVQLWHQRRITGKLLGRREFDR